MEKENMILISAYSRSPQDTASHGLHNIFGLVLLIDKSTDLIIEAEPTWSTGVGRNFVNDLLKGESIRDVENLVRLVESSYFGRPKKTLINQIITCNKIYEEKVLNLRESGSPKTELFEGSCEILDD